MRMPTTLSAVLALATGACVVVDRPEPAPPPAAYRPAAATPTSAPAPAPRVDRDEAIRRALEYARDRGLNVDRVHEARLDGRGRWRVDVRGPTDDRARMLIDAGDGRLLKGRFRDSDPDVDD